MAQLISTQGLSKSYGHKPLFDGINFGIDDSERLGLIGPNGSGKSTLLRILAGEVAPDSGVVSRRRGVRFAFVAQQDVFADGETVRSAMAGALADQHLDDVERDTEIDLMAVRAGFTHLGQLAATLSGGWKKRLAIVSQMLRKPDVMLLDEPTNHLDVEAVIWLEGILKSAPFAYLVVTHDRYFLESVATRTVELSRQYPSGFLSVNGPYSQFLTEREEFLAAQAHHEVALASKVRREIEWLRRGPPARTTKAKYRIDDAGRMMQDLSEIRERNMDERGAKVDFTASSRRTRDLVVGTGLSATRGGKTLFENLDIALAPGMRLGLVGPNGSGKSTLIKMLIGDIEPDAGQVKRAERLSVATLRQDRALLDQRAPLRRALAGDRDAVSFRGENIHVTSWAKRFLFRPEQLDVPVGQLSGGEQARILIANMMQQAADVLVLDEPTNDLDIPTLELLEDSLESFPGALLLVTHDRFMLDAVSTELLALDGGGNASYYIDLAQWQKFQPSADAPPAPSKSSAPAASGGPRTFRGLTRPEQRELDRMEDSITAAEAELKTLRETMASPEVVTDYVKLQEYMARVEEWEQAVAALYARWEELEAKREA